VTTHREASGPVSLASSLVWQAVAARPKNVVPGCTVTGPRPCSRRRREPPAPAPPPPQPGTATAAASQVPGHGVVGDEDGQLPLRRRLRRLERRRPLLAAQLHRVRRLRAWHAAVSHIAAHRVHMTLRTGSGQCRRRCSPSSVAAQRGPLDAARWEATSHLTSKPSSCMLCSWSAGSPQITEESDAACAAAEPTCGRPAGGAHGEPPPLLAFTAGLASAPIRMRPRFRLRGGELVTLQCSTGRTRGYGMACCTGMI
jgi:hypothetical protein